MTTDYSNIFVNEGLSYQSYRDLVDQRLKEGKSTGEDNAEFILQYTKMNVHRMARLDKTVELDAEFLAVLQAVQNKYRLMVISEGWCGDAAQIVPVFKKIETASPDNFELKFVLRDQNLGLIDQFLTNGGRAIPVLLILDAAGKVVRHWGPRPAVLMPMLAAWKTESEDMMVTAEKLHGWYAKDKTKATQQELLEVFKSLN